MGRRGTLVVLATVAVVCGVLAVRASSSSGGSSTAARPRAPVLSLQRVPRLLSRLAGDARLGVALDGALSEARGDACVVVRDAGGRIMYARHPSRTFVPASNLKIITGFTILERLGPTERYRTEAVATSISSGVVSDLWLVGSGDPLLATAEFAATAGYNDLPRTATPIETLADRLVAAGLKEVKGRVVGDESRYDTQRYVPTWKQGYIVGHESGPASALTVNGGFTQSRPAPVPAPAPASHGASVLAALLQARGVTVAGVGEGSAPAGARAIATLESAPMTQVVGEMMRHSDNLAAELMVKELGKRHGSGGTTGAGLEVIKQTVKDSGLSLAELAVFDGSGLDRADRASCGLLVGVLQRAGDRGSLAETLPVAARDGTLARRFLASPAAGKLRAKTGSLEGVMGLSGWVDGEGGVRLVFSLLANGLAREAVGRTLEERVGSVLARYPQAPDPNSLAP